MDDTMAYAVVQDIVGGEWGTYEKIVAEAGVDVTPPAGLIVHAAGQTEQGTRIVDVWESEAAYQQFVTERLRPASQRVQGGVDPTAQPAPLTLEVQHLLKG